MAGICKHRYSVYHKDSELPLILYGTSTECAEAMGVSRNTFYRYLVRMRQGKIKLRKWLVFEDEVEDEE